MNKRAISEQGIFVIIFLVIIAVLIPLTFSVINRALFGRGGEYRTAEASLDSLGEAVLVAVQEPQQVAFVRNFPLFVQDDEYIIVAFNSDDSKTWSWCDGLWGGEWITKPAACLPGKSCLCLYEDVAGIGGSDFDSYTWGTNPPQKCRLFPNNVVFLAPADSIDAPGADPVYRWNWGDSKDRSAESIFKANANGGPMQQYVPQSSYENIVIYGQCKKTVWNKQNVYIEKFAADTGLIYVFIARESPYTQQRFEMLNKTIGVSALA